MPEAVYGKRTIKYSIEEKDGLKSHYISVDKTNGVVLRGEPVVPQKADMMILKKAKWIIEKLDLVSAIDALDIVTGSRLSYLGRRYYVELFINPEAAKPTIAFNHSRFKITIKNTLNQQQEIAQLVSDFYREKAKEKISIRLEKWAERTGLKYNQLKFQKLEKRWGSCTKNNNILINIEAIKLPYTLIDYLLVHELVHTKEKSHSKEFWAELAKHMPQWRALDQQIYGLRV